LKNDTIVFIYVQNMLSRKRIMILKVTTKNIIPI